MGHPTPLRGTGDGVLPRHRRAHGQRARLLRELERWLNPELFTVPVRATPPLDPLALRERAEVLVPPARVVSVPLELKPDEAFIARLAPRTDSAHRPSLPLG
ncbi:MAG: hypothetical protein ACREXU_23340, partial [Gammaproteobacteria bacterium]